MTIQAKAQQFADGVLNAALYTAATVQVLAVRGVTYYVNNEEQVLEALQETTESLLSGIQVVYRNARTAALATYELGTAARQSWEAARPDVTAKASEFNRVVTDLYNGLRSRF